MIGGPFVLDDNEEETYVDTNMRAASIPFKNNIIEFLAFC